MTSQRLDECGVPSAAKADVGAQLRKKDQMMDDLAAAQQRRAAAEESLSEATQRLWAMPNPKDLGL